jgi:hypothetical protein
LTSTKMQTTSILTVIPGGDTRTLTFACSSLPAVYSCSFSPAGLPLSGLSAQQQVTMTVSSLSALLGAGRYSSRQKASMALSRMGLNILTSFVLWLFVPVERRQLRRLLIALITLFLAVGLIACSTSSITDSSGPPPSSSYSFQVNVIAGGNTVRSLSYTLTVQ